MSTDAAKNENPVVLSSASDLESWVKTQGALSQLSEHSHVWIFLQEPGLVGFGVLSEERVEWPPGIHIDWLRVIDLRIFGEKGEWHVWQTGYSQWSGRLRTFSPKDSPSNQAQASGELCLDDEYHALWGTKFESADSPESWVFLVEGRGARIGLPKQSLVSEQTPSFCLGVRHYLEQDEQSGMMGIVDAALFGLFQGRQKHPIFPPKLSE